MNFDKWKFCGAALPVCPACSPPEPRTFEAVDGDPNAFIHVQDTILLDTMLCGLYIGQVYPADAPCQCGHANADHIYDAKSRQRSCYHTHLPEPRGTAWDNVAIGCPCTDYRNFSKGGV